MTKELLPFDTLSFLSKENANKIVDRVMLNTYVNRPDLVVMTEKEIKKTKVFKDNIEKEVSSKPSVAKLFAQEKMIGVKEEAEVVIQKPTGGSPEETVHCKLRRTISPITGIKVVRAQMPCLPICSCSLIIMIRRKFNGRTCWMLN